MKIKMNITGSGRQEATPRTRVARRDNMLKRMKKVLRLLSFIINHYHPHHRLQGSHFLRCMREDDGVGDDFDIVLCKATTHPQEAGMMFYHQHHKVDEQKLELKTSETLCCEVDDVLPPVNFRLQRVRAADAAVARCEIPAGLQQRIEVIVFA